MTDTATLSKPSREQDPRNRLTALLDPGSLELLTPEDDSGMLAVTGTVEADLAAEHELLAGGFSMAREMGVVDEMISPAVTRSALATALAAAPAARGSHGNIPL